MILSAQTIRELCEYEQMIEPFVDQCCVIRGMSYGLSAASYDIRARIHSYHCRISPGGFALIATRERVKMPDDVLGIVHDKSTWARMGLAVQNTHLDPGFYGHVTLELSNHGSNYLDIYNDMPIAQIIFHRLDRPTDRPYSGKYQGQHAEPVPAILEKSFVSREP